MLTTAELESFFFDPREPMYIARCPFCGLDIVLGVRKDNGHASLAHSSHPDPSDPTHTRHMTGCERFSAVAYDADVLPRLQREGARWVKVEGSGFERLGRSQTNGV